MHAFDVLGDPVRRRILEMLADGEVPAGEVTGVVAREFGLSPPTVSGHLRVVREAGFVHVRSAGKRRLYRIETRPLQEADGWLQGIRQLWEQPLDALATELARGRRQARQIGGSDQPDRFR